MRTKVLRKTYAIQAAARAYRRARIALISLGMTLDQHGRFKQLDDSHIKPFMISNSHRELGESRKEASWIWEDLSFVEGAEGDQTEYFEEGALSHIT